MVECDLAKVEVAGSNPVSRSIAIIRHQGEELLMPYCFLARLLSTEPLTLPDYQAVFLVEQPLHPRILAVTGMNRFALTIAHKLKFAIDRRRIERSRSV